MNISHQNWKPDTCECVVEEEYDRDDPQAVMTCSRVLKKCAAHSTVLDKDLYGVIYANEDGENKRKNLLHKHLLENESLSLSTPKVQDDGSEVLEFKNGINYKWSFSGEGKNRILNVDIKGATLDQTQKEAISTYCLDAFKTEKVSIV